jgi:hypothetical protein
VTDEQISQYNVPTRPEKNDASRNAVELDALPPEVLRQLVNDAISQHIPADKLAALHAAEQQGRELLRRIAENLPAVENFLQEE